MKLSDLLKRDEIISVKGPDREISSIVYHSEKASKDSLFFAIDGQFHQGTDHIREAAAKGAAAVAVAGDKKDCMTGKDKDSLTVVRVPNVRRALALASSRMYNNPSGKLLVIGVTGTKGKTTTAFMIRQILQESGIKTGIIGTVENGYDGHMAKANATTPQPPEINSLLAEMAENGCRAAVIEVSSQGLMHSRIDGIDIDIGVFTNISPDHIGKGEHRNFREYLCWKSTLFQKCRWAVANIDDPHTPEILKNSHLEKTVFFGENGSGDLVADDISLKIKNGFPVTTYMLSARLPGKNRTVRPIKVNMAGRFNVENSLAAIGTARLLGVPWKHIDSAMEKIRVPGRVEIVRVNAGFTAMVDYAHNGIALRNLLESLREYRPERIILVFGCGGNRDPGRRREMAMAAAGYADTIIITSDNPRREDPMKIIGDITWAVNETDVLHEKQVLIIPDRKEAIETALNTAGKGDFAVIAGKGHETYQIIGTKVLHFDDREVILSWRKDEP